MPQEFHVLQCYSCQTFQVQQVKKSIKWSCKMCGEKQSIKKVYGRGSGAECRHHVQKLNNLRGQLSSELDQRSSEGSLPELGDCSGVERLKNQRPTSKWNHYVNEVRDSGDDLYTPPEEEWTDPRFTTDQCLFKTATKVSKRKRPIEKDTTQPGNHFSSKWQRFCTDTNSSRYKTMDIVYSDGEDFVKGGNPGDVSALADHGVGLQGCSTDSQKAQNIYRKCSNDRTTDQIQPVSCQDSKNNTIYVDKHTNKWQSRTGIYVKSNSGVDLQNENCASSGTLCEKKPRTDCTRQTELMVEKKVNRNCPSSSSTRTKWDKYVSDEAVHSTKENKPADKGCDRLYEKDNVQINIMSFVRQDSNQENNTINLETQHSSDILYISGKEQTQHSSILLDSKSSTDTSAHTLHTKENNIFSNRDTENLSKWDQFVTSNSPDKNEFASEKETPRFKSEKKLDVTLFGKVQQCSGTEGTAIAQDKTKHCKYDENENQENCEKIATRSHIENRQHQSSMNKSVFARNPLFSLGDLNDTDLDLSF